MDTLIPTESIVDKRSGPVKAWAFSSLQVFETCPHRTFLKSVKRLKEPSNKFMERGTAIHLVAEEYVNGKQSELPKELLKFEKPLDELRELFIEGKVEVEGDWGFDQDWQQCGFFDQDVWLRIKIDAVVFESETSARVIDYKTGKKFGNEIKHNQQLMIYAIAAFARFPELEHVTAELWYFDQAQTTTKSYSRQAAMLYMPRWEKRAIKMTTAEEFPPKPSKQNCRYCYYNDSRDCEWGVEID